MKLTNTFQRDSLLHQEGYILSLVKDVEKTWKLNLLPFFIVFFVFGTATIYFRFFANYYSRDLYVFPLGFLGIFLLLFLVIIFSEKDCYLLSKNNLDESTLRNLRQEMIDCLFFDNNVIIGRKDIFILAKNGIRLLPKEEIEDLDILCVYGRASLKWLNIILTTKQGKITFSIADTWKNSRFVNAYQYKSIFLPLTILRRKSKEDLSIYQVNGLPKGMKRTPLKDLILKKY